MENCAWGRCGWGEDQGPKMMGGGGGRGQLGRAERVGQTVWRVLGDFVVVWLV